MTTRGLQGANRARLGAHSACAEQGMPSAVGGLLLLVLGASWLHPAPCAAQDRPPAGWGVRVVDAASGVPVAGVAVRFPDLEVSSVATDAAGRAEMPPEVVGGAVRVVVGRVGYAELDTLVSAQARGAVVHLALRSAPVGLTGLEVGARGGAGDSRGLARLIFEREVAVGAVGMTAEDIRAVPEVGEPDVLRSLQSLAGVSTVNDFYASMYLRGGDADQVGVLWEGAPVFAPFHMFGIFGVFNSDVVETAELYKGSMPARYGGSASGVLSVHQRLGEGSDLRARGGLSLLGVRTAVGGEFAWKGGRWMAAARRATVDVVPGSVPYSFYDVNAGLRVFPNQDHRVGLSTLASKDHFAMGLDEGSSLEAKWSNAVASLSWSWVRGSRLSGETVAYASRYDGSLAVGGGSSPGVPYSAVSANGLRSEVALRGDRAGVRAGAALEGGSVSLVGSAPGGYLEGDASGSYLQLSAFGEVERWFGPLRMASGIRTSLETSASRAMIEPRLAARLHLGPLAVSAGVDRAYQVLSVLRDDRYPMPGTPMWFLRGRDEPALEADGASLALEAWQGEGWTGSATGWARRFRGLASWQPQAERLVSEVAFHEGRGWGLEATVQRHTGLVRGWASYQWSRVRLAEGEDAEYLAPWDRRHEAEAVVTVPTRRGLSVSFRAAFATGAPFWVPLGFFGSLRYDPNTASSNRFWDDPDVPRDYTLGEVGRAGGTYTVLSDTQGRASSYFRADLSLRYAIRRKSWEATPFLSVVNVTAHENVYSFDPNYLGRLDPDGSPNSQIPPLPIPFVGVDFSF